MPVPKTKGLIDPTIEKALENAEIHSHCEQRGVVQLTVEERKLPPLPINQLEFEREPQMDNYKKLRADLAAKYPYKEPPPPKDDEPEPMTEKR